MESESELVHRYKFYMGKILNLTGLSSTDPATTKLSIYQAPDFDHELTVLAIDQLFNYLRQLQLWVKYLRKIYQLRSAVQDRFHKTNPDPGHVNARKYFGILVDDCETKLAHYRILYDELFSHLNNQPPETVLKVKTPVTISKNQRKKLVAKDPTLYQSRPKPRFVPLPPAPIDYDDLLDSIYTPQFLIDFLQRSLADRAMVRSWVSSQTLKTMIMTTKFFDHCAYDLIILCLHGFVESYIRSRFKVAKESFLSGKTRIKSFHQLATNYLKFLTEHYLLLPRCLEHLIIDIAHYQIDQTIVNATDEDRATMKKFSNNPEDLEGLMATLIIHNRVSDLTFDRPWLNLLCEIVRYRSWNPRQILMVKGPLILALMHYYRCPYDLDHFPTDRNLLNDRTDCAPFQGLVERLDRFMNLEYDYYTRIIEYPSGGIFTMDKLNDLTKDPTIDPAELSNRLQDLRRLITNPSTGMISWFCEDLSQLIAAVTIENWIYKAAIILIEQVKEQDQLNLSRLPGDRVNRQLLNFRKFSTRVGLDLQTTESRAILSQAAISYGEADGGLNEFISGVVRNKLGPTTYCRLCQFLTCFDSGLEVPYDFGGQVSVVLAHKIMSHADRAMLSSLASNLPLNRQYDFLHDLIYCLRTEEDNEIMMRKYH